MQLTLKGVNMKYTETKCEWCKGVTRGDVCPQSSECPTCLVNAGASCKRPSGHRAAELHKDRVKKAYAIDDANNFDWQTAYADKIAVTV